MVGLNDELYFIACGFHRTIVRSYNVLTRKWTARGGLKQRTQDDCIKAVTLNESIYVVFSKAIFILFFLDFPKPFHFFKFRFWVSFFD